MWQDPACINCIHDFCVHGANLHRVVTAIFLLEAAAQVLPQWQRRAIFKSLLFSIIITFLMFLESSPTIGHACSSVPPTLKTKHIYD